MNENIAPDVSIVRTGAANLASVFAALRRVGARPRLCESPGEAATAPRLVLPGVGTFGPAMRKLRQDGLVEPLRERLKEGLPTLAVCLGMQLLAEESEENPGVRGLAALPVRATRFRGAMRVPQLGWNSVRPETGGRLLAPGDAYFANSFRLTERPEGWSAAWSDYGGRFVAALEKGDLLACQFHPELSGAWGLSLLRRWLDCNATADVGPAARTKDGGETMSPGGPAVRVIPCLDTRNGRVVKGVKFQNLRDAGSPEQLAAAYEAQGADELVLLDVSATPEGRGNALDTVRRVREALSIPLAVGGGVRDLEDAARLLEAGADKVAVNTAAVRRPELIGELAERFGRQCVVLALDAAREGAAWKVVVRSGAERTGLDAVAWAAQCAGAGAGEILLTSWDRDGTRAGYDCELLHAITGAVGIPIVASGGASSPCHMIEAVRAGADAVLAASLFHDGDYRVREVKQELRRANIAVRDEGDETC